MALPMEKLKTEAAEERRRLSAGERPKSRFPNKLQRTAAKALAAFFVLMLALTLISRAADGVTVAKVEAEIPKTGILTQRFEAGGTIEPQGDLLLTLPGGIGVEKIAAVMGQRVQAGDVLLELDEAGIQRTLQKLRDDMRILNLKLQSAAQGNTSADADAILAAQKALENAQEDYDRLVTGRERTEGRWSEDLDAAGETYNEAIVALAKAQAKAKETLIETAEEKVKTAQATLTEVKDTAQSAIDAAQQQLENSRDAEKSLAKQVDNAQNNLEDAQARYEDAKAAYDKAVSSGTTDQKVLDQLLSEIDLAGDEVDRAKSVYDNMGSLHPGETIRRDMVNLQRVKERQGEKVKAAEEKLQEAQNDLTAAQENEDMSEEALVISAQSAVDAAQAALKTAQRGAEDAGTTGDDALFTAERAIETAQQGVESAEKKAEEARNADEKTRRQAEIERLGYQSEKRTLQQQLDVMEEVANAGGKLISPVAGTVQFILEDTGKTQDGGKVAVLSRSDEGFRFAAELDQKEAEKLAVGDLGVVTFTLEGKSQGAEGRISAIGAANDKGKVTLTVALPEGIFPSGVTAKFEISRRSEQYNSVLPLGALRSDGGGTFVLVLRETQTVMGIEQTVEKLPVTVLEQDSEQMAVESSLQYDDKVVVSANKPIAEGDRVRLETEEDK